MLAIHRNSFIVIKKRKSFVVGNGCKNFFFKSFLSPARGYSEKTSVSILNKAPNAGLLINTFSLYGFRLSNEAVVIGPMIIFPRSVLSWNICSSYDITEESLTLFKILEPKFDVLVIGVGDQCIRSDWFRKMITLSKKSQANIEVLPTEKACATFNFLNLENRMVAAALIPPFYSFGPNI